MTKERKSNFELLRIVAMLLIIIWHVILHAELLDLTTDVNQLLVRFIFIFFCIHVNIFVLITGYFQYNKSISYKKFLKLFNGLWFYTAVFAIGFYFFGNQIFPKINFIKEILPLPSSGDYWFIKNYLALYLLTPFINNLIASMSQQNHRKLIIISFILFSIVPYFTRNIGIKNDGYNIINFVFLYLIGAYLGKYPIKENLHFKNYSAAKRRLIFLTLFLFFGLFNFLLCEFSSHLRVCDSVTFKELGYIFGNSFASFSNPFVILEGVFFFLYFESLDIKNNFINKVSPTIMGIYLLHENSHVYNYIYKNTNLFNEAMISSSKLIMYVVVVSIAIFIICALIEKIRLVIFNFIGSRKPVIRIEKSISDYLKSF